MRWTHHRWPWLVIAATLAQACVDERGVVPDAATADAGVSTHDAHVPADAALPPPPPPPGAFALAVEDAYWARDEWNRLRLWIDVRLTNGAASDPLPLDGDFFTVRTDGGVEVSLLELGGDLCGPSYSVAAQGTLACELDLSMPEDHFPLELIYRAPDGREARAAIVACGPSALRGLCEPSLECGATGACEEPCSLSAPAGPCADPAHICDEGWCRYPCSPEHPTGGCEVGVCYRGSCDATCTQYEWLAGDCMDCVYTLVAGPNEPPACASPASGCADPVACLMCPTGISASTCSCPEDPACDGCEPDAPGLYDCILTHCPVCRL